MAYGSRVHAGRAEAAGSRLGGWTSKLRVQVLNHRREAESSLGSAQGFETTFIDMSCSWPVISPLGRQRQEDQGFNIIAGYISEFEASLRPYLHETPSQATRK